LRNEPQAYAKLIEGEILLRKGESRAAVRAFSEANALVDTWIGRFNLGRAYLEAGALTEADSEFDRCIKRRGEALALFLDEWPTYGYFPSVYYYMGRRPRGNEERRFCGILSDLPVNPRKQY
jgi:tetratricopeptide (TPR) repeat protein